MRLGWLALGAALLTGDAVAQEVDLSQFEDILEPRVATHESETVLEVRAVGDPNVMGGSAFGLLFQLYFAAPETPKGPAMPIPKARWPSEAGTPRDEWVGLYALTVPAGTNLPPHEAPAGIEARITMWEYGEVVEVLYKGPYDREQPTLDGLKGFAAAEGYEALPTHEEVYVKGPTMAGPGDPEEYLTILRYRVRRN